MVDGELRFFKEEEALNDPDFNDYEEDSMLVQELNIEGFIRTFKYKNNRKKQRLCSFI